MKTDYQPVILIGAARSGTKILRDTIATHEAISKIGFDINFIWKRHNESVAHDVLSPDQASDKVIRYVHSYFGKNTDGKKIIIEKTVSNTLRIPFLLKIFPNAKFIFLYRDGRDAVEFVRRQWGAAPDGKYLVKKFLSVPFFDIIPYVFKYAIDLIRIKLNLKTTDSYVWGVKYPDFEEDLSSKSVLDFCAIQWNHCIDAMKRDWPLVKDQGLVVRYEEFIDNPTGVLNEVGQFLNLDATAFDSSAIRKGTVGKAKVQLSTEEYEGISTALESNLKHLNYVS